MIDSVTLRETILAFREMKEYKDFITKNDYKSLRLKLINELPDYSTNPNEAGLFLKKFPFYSEKTWLKVEGSDWPRIAGELDAQLIIDHFEAEQERWLSKANQVRHAVQSASEILVKFGIKITLKKIEEPTLANASGVKWLYIEQLNTDIAAPTPPFRFVRIESIFMPDRFQLKLHQRWKAGVSHYRKSDPLEVFQVKIPRFIPTPTTPLDELKTFKNEVRISMQIKEEFLEKLSHLKL